MKPLTSLLLSQLDSSEDSSNIQTLNPNQRFFLSESNEIWIIESGSGDLFLLERVNNLPEGPLSHIAHIETGFFLFGFPQRPESKQFSYLYIASSKTRLKKLSIPLIQKLVENDLEMSEQIERGITQWVNHFSYLYSGKPMPDEFVELPLESERFQLNAGTIFFPVHLAAPEHKHDAIWVSVLRGNVAILDDANFTLAEGQSAFPFIFNVWAKIIEDTELKIFKTRTLLLDASIWTALFNFQECVQLFNFQYMKLQEKSMRTQLTLKEELEEQLLSHSFDRMASILNISHDSSPLTEKDSLLAAMQLLGKNLNIRFTASSSKSFKANRLDRITEICRTSRIRFRKVLLEPNWWRSDCGPLLGFYGPENRPIALLRQKGHYIAVDPHTMDRMVINEKIDENIARNVYVFYQPFPEGELRGSSIIKFCLSGRLKEILLILAAGTMGAILSLFPPLANQLLFSRVIGNGEHMIFTEIILGLIIVAISTTIFLVTRSYATARLAQMVDSKLESALWDRILNLPATFFRKFSSGNLIQRIYAVSQMHQLLTGNALKVILSAIFSIFYFVAMIYYNSTLAMVGLGIVVLALIISATCVSIKTQIQRKILELNGQINGTLIQLISGISKLRVAGAENRAFSYWSDQFAVSKKLQYKSRVVQSIVTVTTAVLPVLSSAALFTVVINMLQEGSSNLSIGIVIAFMAAFFPFSQAIFDAINTVVNLSSVAPLWERAKVILMAEPEVTQEKERLETFNGNVSIDHVHFRYEKDSPKILNDISLHASAGEFIAIVGPSGCGKSTLVRLLIGFESAEQGTIYYDNKDISTVDLKELRRKIGTVLQNGAIFSGSIHENITCGGSFSFSEIEHALELSGFAEDLRSLPMGLHTILQSGGGTLSGGQAQRLLIARALITRPKIIIFDEATSALDTKTQETISVNLDKINVTRIVIAHRLSTIKNADRIYVLEKGQIVETGTFAELAHRSSDTLFKQMLKRQTL